MTTATSKELVVRDKAHHDDLSEKDSPSFGKRFGAIIFYILAVIVAVLALQTTGFVGAYQYDTALWLIVLVFNLLVMAWPTYLVAKLVATKPQHWVLNLAFRGGVIAASLIFTLFLFPLIIPAQGDLGSKLWNVPFFGPIILPLAAVVLHAVAALLLTRYTAIDPQIAEDKAAMPDLEMDLREAKRKYAQLERAHLASVRVVDGTQPLYDFAQTDKNTASENLKEAQKTFNESAPVMRKLDIDRLITTNKGKREELVAAIADHKRKIEASKKGPVRTEHESILEDLEENLRQLQVEGTQLKQHAKALSDEIDSSALKAALTRLAAVATDTSNEEVAKRKLIDNAITKRDEAAEALQAAGYEVDLTKQALTDTQQRIKGSDKESSVLWRDLAFLPAISFALLVLDFFVLYTTWYGWVLVTIG